MYMENLQEKYNLFLHSKEKQLMFKNFDFSKLKIKCSECDLETNINGCTSHVHKVHKKMFHDKVKKINEVFNINEKCILCDKEISLEKYLLDKKRLSNFYISTCNSKCWWKVLNFIHNYNNNLKECVVCKNDFIHIKNVVCSKECEIKHKKETVKNWHLESKNAKYYIKRNEKISKSRIGKKNNFEIWNKNLSGEEYLKHYEKNGVNTLYEALKKQKNSWYKKTSIEQKMEDLLIKLDIDYIYCFFYKNRQYDFKIKLNDEKMYIIETDGDYFHKSTRRCLDENERKKSRQSDLDKEKILYDGFGKDKCTVLRFWEYNINNHMDEIENLLISLKESEDKIKIVKKIKKMYNKYE